MLYNRARKKLDRQTLKKNIETLRVTLIMLIDSEIVKKQKNSIKYKK